MEVVSQVLTTGSILGLIAIMFRWVWMRIAKMEKCHRATMFTDAQQPRYVTTEICGQKFDELKKLLLTMDKKREKAKDVFANGQVAIESRLTAIETRLKGM